MGLTTIAFVLAYAAGCAMAFARHPIYGLVTYVAVFYLHPPSRWWGSSLPDPGWAMIAAAVTLLAVMLRKDTISLAPLFRQGIFVGFIIFVVWACVQSPWALNPPMH